MNRKDPTNYIFVGDLPCEKKCQEMLEWNYRVLHKVADLMDEGKIQDDIVLRFLQENTAILENLIAG